MPGDAPRPRVPPRHRIARRRPRWWRARSAGSASSRSAGSWRRCPRRRARVRPRAAAPSRARRGRRTIPVRAELVGGGAPTATSLFYSYPPPVAQAMSASSRASRHGCLVLWGTGAVAGLLVVDRALRRRLAPDRSRAVVLVICAAAAPLTLPFTVGLLSGTSTSGSRSSTGRCCSRSSTPAPAPRRRRRRRARARVAEAPPSLAGLVVPRPGVPRSASAGGLGSSSRRSIAVGRRSCSIVGASVVIGGTALWAEYARGRPGGRRRRDRRSAQCRHRRPACRRWSGAATRWRERCTSQLAVAALAVTVWAAWRRPDAVESFAWAAAASLATLPVTWYHYPSAMIPVAIAAMASRGSGLGQRAFASRSWPP